MNHIELFGRLTKDPEVKTTANSVEVVQFTVAVDRKYKNADGTRTTDFINCVAWRNTAKLIGQYFHKGNRILIGGNLQTRTYDDNNGQKHYVSEVIVEDIDFIESASSNQQNTPPPPPEPPQQAPVAPAVNIAPEYLPDEAIDLPFEV